MRTIAEPEFVEAGLRQLGDPDRARARAVRLRPMDSLAAIVQAIAS